MNVEPFALGDLSQIAHLQPEGWQPIRLAYEFYSSNNFCRPVKCVVEKKIIGIGSSILHDGSGWLGHIIVDKDFRNQGIGTLITDSLINQLDRSSVKTILLIATPLGEPVYRKLGFEKETIYIFLKDGKTNDLPLNRTEPFQKKYKASLLKLDEHISGERRVKLLEPHLAGALVMVDRGNVSGFFMPTLGEGYIIADRHETGKQLLQIKHRTIDHTSIPMDNQPAIQFLMDNGFVEFRRAARMWRGEKLSWQPAKLFGRIGGNLG